MGTGRMAPGTTGRAPRKGVGVQLGYHSITWGGVVGHPQGVTSAKDLYYLTYGSMEQAVGDIAAAAHTGAAHIESEAPRASMPATQMISGMSADPLI